MPGNNFDQQVLFVSLAMAGVSIDDDWSLFALRLGMCRPRNRHDRPERSEHHEPRRNQDKHRGGSGNQQQAQIDSDDRNGRQQNVENHEDKRRFRQSLSSWRLPILYPSTAFRTATRARSRVESSVGNGDESGVTSNGISVQPSTTASQPSSFIARMTST